MKTQTDNSFQRELRELLSGGKTHTDYSELTRSLLCAFLDFGSETPDNVNCSRHIEYGVISEQGRPQALGLKIRGKNIGLAGLANLLENIELPEDIAKELPSLTKEEWDAFTRMVTMILLALQRE
jgi:hypothetical protein